MSSNRKSLILRGVENGAKKATPLPPGVTTSNLKQVWTLLNEAKFNIVGLVHFKTAFLEDRMHDWDLSKDGGLRFYGHSGSKGEMHDLVLVYEV